MYFWVPCPMRAWPQSFSAPEVPLLVVLVPGFGSVVCLVSGDGRAVVPGGARVRTGSDRAGQASFRVAGMVRAGQAGAGRAHSRCQQVRNASFQGQSGLIFKMRSRACRASRAGMCQTR